MTPFEVPLKRPLPAKSVHMIFIYKSIRLASRRALVRIHCYAKPYTCGKELGAKGIALPIDSFEECIELNGLIAPVCSSVDVQVIDREDLVIQYGYKHKLVYNNNNNDIRHCVCC